MSSTRVVQITDLHLLATPGELLYGVDTGLSLEKTLNDIRTLSVKPDALVVTGDIAEDGKVETYHRARSFLSALNIPVYSLPGNHDSLDHMLNDLKSDSIHVDPFTKIGHWQILFIDSTVNGKDHGNVSTEGLKQLDNHLSDNGEPCVVAIHHTPTYECSAHDCQLQNRERLLDLLQQHDHVKGVIAGHTHCQSEIQHQHIQLMATPSTFLHVEHLSQDLATDHSILNKTHTINDKKQGYRILDLFDDGSIETEVCWIDSTSL